MDVVVVGSTTNYRHYIYAGDEAIAVYSRMTGSSTYPMSYLLEDHEGGVATITANSSSGGPNGTGIDVYESFTPFGARRNPATWSGTPTSSDLTEIASLSRQSYTFQTALGQSMGLNHMNGRVEDAVTGRFLSPDPYVMAPSNSQSFNRYSNVNNNPLRYWDPTGFNACSVSIPLDLPALINDEGNTIVPEELSDANIEGPCPDLSPPPEIQLPNMQSLLPGPYVNVLDGLKEFGIPEISDITTCMGQAHTTGNTNNGVHGALPNQIVGPGNIAIDPAVLGLIAGASANNVLNKYGPQIVVTFSPQPRLPAGFPTIFTVADVVGPASSRGWNPPDYDINGLPDDNRAAFNASGRRQVTVSFPDSAPFKCGTGVQPAN